MFTVSQILEATGGRLVRGAADAACGAVSTDSRSFARGQTFVAIKGDSFDGHAFIPRVIRAGAACVVFARGSRSSFPAGRAALVAVDDPVQALADIARFHRLRFDIPVIAITGSNGKTTTKDMCAWLLSERMRTLVTEGTKNNHIGVPQTLLRLTDQDRAAVIEMGTNHFGEIAHLAKACLPTVGIITSIGPSHLEYFKDRAGVLREKRTLFEHLAAPAVGIVNADDPLLARTFVAKKRKPFIISIGVRSRADFRPRAVEAREGRVSFTLGGSAFVLNTPGYHNVYNALAACAACRVLGMDYRSMARRLARFEFPAGRLKVLSLMGATFIDDSYNSSPASLAAALEALKGYRARRRICVMGDMRELGTAGERLHREAGRTAVRACDVLVAVGGLAHKALEAFRRAGGKASYACASAEEARRVLREEILPASGDVILVKGSRAVKLDHIFK